MSDTKQQQDKARELEKKELEQVQGAGPKYSITAEKTEERVSSKRLGGDERKRSRYSNPG
jgi:hypothetical protein